MTAREVIGVLLLALTGAVGLWQARRVSAANPGLRMPLFRRPPAVPHGSTLISALGGALGALGFTLFSYSDGDRFVTWRFALAVLLLAVFVAVPTAMQRRRVSR